MDRWSRDALMDMSRVSIYASFLFFTHACAGLRMCIFAPTWLWGRCVHSCVFVKNASSDFLSNRSTLANLIMTASDYYNISGPECGFKI